MSVGVEILPGELLVDVAPVVAPKVDPRISRAKPSVYRFLGLVAQLALLLTVIRAYRVEQFLNGYLGFFSMCCVAFGAFTIHYWLPFELKERFWVAVSIGAAFLFLPVWVAVEILVAGAALYLTWRAAWRTGHGWGSSWPVWRR